MRAGAAHIEYEEVGDPVCFTRQPHCVVGVGGGGVPVSLSVDRGVRGGQTRRPVGSGQRTAMHVASAWTCDCLWMRDCLAARDSDCLWTR